MNGDDEKRSAPRPGSVTNLPCKCGYLQEASAEPTNPILFDEQMNEYYLEHIDLDGTGRRMLSIVFHCLRCGGAATESLRAMFFAAISKAEERRLRALTSGVRTVADAIAKLGPPEEDRPRGLTVESPSSNSEPSTVRSYRVLRYTRLSETAHVKFVDYGPERGLHMTLEGKYIGPPRSRP